MREVRYKPPPETAVKPATPARVYVLPEPWVISAARKAGALLGEMAGNAARPYGAAAVLGFARRHPFAMFAAASAGFLFGRVILRMADVLSER
jgi:hypothetical protein